MSKLPHHGYPEMVTQDIKDLKTIISRQGIMLTLHIVVEAMAEGSTGFTMTPKDRRNMLENYISELRLSAERQLKLTKVEDK